MEVETASACPRRRSGLGIYAARAMQAVGVFLLAVTVWGKWRANDHRARLGVSMSYAAALDEMDRWRHASGSHYDFLVGVTKAYAEAIHYTWPKSRARVPLTDNWILHSCAFLDPWLVSSGRTDVPQLFGVFQSTDYTRGFRRGFGICSQNALGLADLLQRRYQIGADVVSLDGHVVIEAIIDGEHSLHDPSLGLSFRFGVDEIDAARLGEIERRYASTPFPELGRTYDSAGNSRAKDGAAGYRPLLYRVERVADWLKWIVPVILIWLGRRVARRASPVSAT